MESRARLHCYVNNYGDMIIYHKREHYSTDTYSLFTDLELWLGKALGKELASDLGYLCIVCDDQGC